MAREKYSFETNIDGLPVTVKFTYIEGRPATHLDPPEYDEVEIEEVFAKERSPTGVVLAEHNILGGLNEDALETLTEKCHDYADERRS